MHERDSNMAVLKASAGFLHKLCNLQLRVHIPSSVKLFNKAALCFIKFRVSPNLNIALQFRVSPRLNLTLSNQV